MTAVTSAATYRAMSDNKTESSEAAKDETCMPSTSTSDAADNKDSEEPGVTMLDVLQDEQDLEDDANAVLGAADDKNCTYNQGEPWSF